MNQIRGLFSTPFRSSTAIYGIDYEHFAAQGCTDIFMNGSSLGISTGQYNSVVSQLQELLTFLDGTDMNLWLDTTVFLTTTTTPYVWTDPTDTTHADLVASQLTQLLIDVPELKGVSFDDYNYQPYLSTPTAGHWPGSDGQSYEYPLLEQAMADFGSRMAEIVHDADKLIGCSVPAYPNTGGANTKLLSEVFDFISPEIYFYDPTICDQKYFEKMILSHTRLMDDPSKLIPLLSTYNPSTQVKSKTSNVECEINTALTGGCGGYILFSEGSMNSDITFRSSSDFELNIGLSVDKGNIIPEKSSRKLIVTLTDKNGLPIPDSIVQRATGSYKVVDKATKVEITAATPFNITGNIATIPLSSTQNSMIHNLNTEQHSIVVTVLYGNGQEENAELDVTIQNLAGI